LAESIKGVIVNNDYIQETWVGEINPRQFIAIIINLLFIGLGISISFKKYGWFGLFPLSIHLFYNLSNGLARVSGWRYVIVTDWVIILYYMVGIIFILHTLLHKIGLADIGSNVFSNHETVLSGYKEKSTIQRPIILSSIIIVALISIGMVLPEILIEKEYRGEITKDEFLQLMGLYNIDYDHDKMRSLADDPDFVYIHTKAFYPRYYEPGEGEPGFNIEWISAKEYGNLGFMIVSPQITGASIEVEKSPEFFPHDTDVFIIGKWVPSNFIGKYIEANVIYFPENGYLITSQNFP
jgi:hypothetical protein